MGDSYPQRGNYDYIKKKSEEVFFDPRIATKEIVDEVFEIVRSSSTLVPIDLEEITESSKGSEYRGRNLPLYKVTSLNDKDKKINLYLNVFSGEITAVRSLQWRIWDLMWGFHIMDWQTRDKINNIFLKIFSILALVSSISGIMLFFRVDFNSK